MSEGVLFSRLLEGLIGCPVNNYHPVSLLSVVSKIFEKLVNNRLIDHLEKRDLFFNFQYGFRSS